LQSAPNDIDPGHVRLWQFRSVTRADAIEDSLRLKCQAETLQLLRQINPAGAAVLALALPGGSSDMTAYNERSVLQRNVGRMLPKFAAGPKRSSSKHRSIGPRWTSGTTQMPLVGTTVEGTDSVILSQSLNPDAPRPWRFEERRSPVPRASAVEPLTWSKGPVKQQQRVIGELLDVNRAASAQSMLSLAGSIATRYAG
jgi:hypothetical protein